MIQIYGRKKCKDTQKAQRFFKERGIAFQFVDLELKTPGARELELFISTVGQDELLDRDGKAFKDRGLAYMDFDAVEEIEANQRLMRTPVVRDGRSVAVGDNQSFWKQLAEGASRG